MRVRHPHVLQLIMDSLRYWVTEMHVDGFRFDLAATLAREFYDVDRLSSFFDLVQQDPVVSQVKLIAEPWDVGEGGYQVGNFPPLWTEWNGKYRDTVRDFWRGADHGIAEFASRLTGSSDLYQFTGRRPSASINFVTAHDGFTLADLVSYNDKHNEANGEENRDGSDDNRSWNCGVEGPTDDPAVRARRAAQTRNLLTTLFLSQGVPMLVAGDEMARTQGGNNNAYCQDNETSWLDWSHLSEHADLVRFTADVARLRRDHPVFRRRRFFHGAPIRGTGERAGAMLGAAMEPAETAPSDTAPAETAPVDTALTALKDIVWLRPDGVEMTDHDWEAGTARSLAVFLNGAGIPDPDTRGEPVADDSFLLFFNAHSETVTFQLPPAEFAASWEIVVDTRASTTSLDAAGPRQVGAGEARTGERQVKAGDSVSLDDRSTVVLRRVE
jgi:glycogen operon protein